MSVIPETVEERLREYRNNLHVYDHSKLSDEYVIAFARAEVSLAMAEKRAACEKAWNEGAAAAEDGNESENPYARKAST